MLAAAVGIWCTTLGVLSVRRQERKATHLGYSTHVALLNGALTRGLSLGSGFLRQRFEKKNAVEIYLCMRACTGTRDGPRW